MSPVALLDGFVRASGVRQKQVATFRRAAATRGRPLSKEALQTPYACAMLTVGIFGSCLQFVIARCCRHYDAAADTADWYSWLHESKVV